MINLGRAAFTALALAASLVAPLGEAWAEPLGCFRGNEIDAEREVRHGLRLREAAKRCEAAGLAPGALERWTAINDKQGKRFAKQTGIREKAYKREFPNQSNIATAIEAWDGRLVMFYRHYSVNKPFCDSIDSMLTDIEKKGWNAFRRQADKAKPEIRAQYRSC